MNCGITSEETQNNKNGCSEKPHIDDKNEDLWELAASCVDFSPPRHPKLF